MDLVDAAQSRKIIRIKDAGRRIFQIKEFRSRYGCSFRISVGDHRHIFIRHIDSFFLQGMIKTAQPTSGNRRIFTMNVCYFAMSLLKNVGNKICHSLNIVGDHCNSAVKYMINGNNRDFGLYQSADFFCKKVDAGDHNSVYAPVTAVFIITEMPSGEIPTGKSDVVPSGFSGTFKTFEYMIKIIMGQTAHGFVYKKDTKIICSFRLKCSCRGIWKIAHF